MTPTQADIDHAETVRHRITEAALAGEGAGAISRIMANALANVREQGRREMQAECAGVADEEAAGCETKRVVPGDLERNYFGGGLRASKAIAAAIRALKA